MPPAMPKRPRSHVAETSSRRAFDQFIPDDWTTSTVENDYGLDTRVEIFEQGFATALGFWVQLKGTDERNLSKALAESFDVTALNYMAAQAEPVLVVRHHGPTGRLFGFWLHRKNVVVKKAEQKTVTLRWTEDDALTDAVVEALHEEARRFRVFRSHIDSGLDVRLVLGSDMTDERDLLIMTLESLARRSGHFLRFPEDVTSPEVTVICNRTELVVDMSVVSFRVTNTVGDDVGLLAQSILLLGAACLTKLGRPDVAVDIVLVCQDTPLLATEELALILVASFQQARRWRDAVEVLRADRSAGRVEPFATLLISSLALDTRMPEAEAAYAASGLAERGQLLAERGDPQAAATCYYTAANLFFHTAYDYAAALQTYLRAGEAWPDYRQRSYYCAELAAGYFENDQYEHAVQWYRSARRLDPADLALLAKQADAHVYDGSYAEGERLLAEYSSSDVSGSPAIWALKRLALLALMEMTQVVAQHRNPEAAERLLVAEGPSAVDRAWRLDALCPAAWSSVVEQGWGGDVGARNALLILCAFPARGALQPWGYLLLLTHVTEEQPDLFRLSVAAAWFRLREQLVDEVMQVSSALDATLRRSLLAALNLEIERLRAEPEFGTARMLDQDGGVTSFNIRI